MRGCVGGGGLREAHTACLYFPLASTHLTRHASPPQSCASTFPASAAARSSWDPMCPRMWQTQHRPCTSTASSRRWAPDLVGCGPGRGGAAGCSWATASGDETCLPAPRRKHPRAPPSTPPPPACVRVCLQRTRHGGAGAWRQRRQQMAPRRLCRPGLLHRRDSCGTQAVNKRAPSLRSMYASICPYFTLLKCEKLQSVGWFLQGARRGSWHCRYDSQSRATVSLSAGRPACRSSCTAFTDLMAAMPAAVPAHADCRASACGNDGSTRFG